MSRYGTSVSNFVTTTSVKTAIMIWGMANRRAEVTELSMTGAGLAAVSDVPQQMTAAYCATTVVGVGSTVTPEKISGQGAAAAGSCTTTAFTTEPTAYATVFPVLYRFNPRGGQRWAVTPGMGLMVDSGATNNRLGWRAQGQAAGAIDALIQWGED